MFDCGNNYCIFVMGHGADNYPMSRKELYVRKEGWVV